MTKKCILLLSLLLSLHLQAQMRWNSVYQSYIDQYKNLAIEEMLRYNIPASITLAQGLFESGAGRSELSIKGNTSVFAPMTTRCRATRTTAAF